MQYRKIVSKQDIETVFDWWKQHGFEPIPMDNLPQNGGYIVSNKGEDVISGWLYMTNSKIAMMEWVVDNPKAGGDVKKGVELKRGAFEYLNQVLSIIAKERGADKLITYTPNKGFMNKLKKNGWKETETNTHLIKIL